MKKNKKSRKNKRKKEKTDKKQDSRKIANLILRYVIIVILSINSWFIFYNLFRPLTVYPVTWILSIFYEVVLESTYFISVQGHLIEFVGACIAGAAYYLLVALNLTTSSISWLKRAKIFLFTAGSLLILNILRIVILTVLLVSESAFFDVTHFIFWHFLSVVFVVLIWILALKIYKIKTIPIVSDILYLKDLIKKGEKKKSKKKRK